MSDTRSRREALEALQAELAELRSGADVVALQDAVAEFSRRREAAVASNAAMERVLEVEAGRLADALELAQFRRSLRPAPPRERRAAGERDWQQLAALVLAAGGFLLGRFAAGVDPRLPWVFAAAATWVAVTLGLKAGRFQRALQRAEQVRRRP